MATGWLDARADIQPGSEDALMTIPKRHKFLGRIQSLDVVTEPEEVSTKPNTMQSPIEKWNKARVVMMDYAKLRIIVKEHKNK